MTTNYETPPSYSPPSPGSQAGRFAVNFSEAEHSKKIEKAKEYLVKIVGSDILDGLTEDEIIEVINETFEGLNWEQIDRLIGEAEPTAEDRKWDAQLSNFLWQNRPMGETYEQPLLNADIMDFLRGKPIVLTDDLLHLRDGSTTNIVSLEMYRNGSYSAEERYFFRAIFKMIITTGSHDEKLTAIEFGEQLQVFAEGNGYDIYDGSDQVSVMADGGYIFNVAKEYNRYAAGSDKSKGSTGRGNNRRAIESNIGNVSDTIRNLLFRDGCPKGIGLYDPETGKFADSVNSYGELNEFGKAVISSAAKYIRSIKSGKAIDAFQGLTGKDKRLPLLVFKLWEALRQEPLGAPQTKAAYAMLGIEESDRELINTELIALGESLNEPMTISTLRLHDGNDGKEVSKLLERMAEETKDNPSRYGGMLTASI